MELKAPLLVVVLAFLSRCPLHAQSASVVRLPDGVTKTPYSVQLAANGTASLLHWAVSEGALPPGLHLTQRGTSVHVEGTPVAFQKSAYVFELTASDDSHEGIQRFSILVKPIAVQIVAVAAGTPDLHPAVALADSDRPAPPIIAPPEPVTRQLIASPQAQPIVSSVEAAPITAYAARGAAATLQTITVTPTNPSIAMGGTQQFTATGNYSDASTQNITPSVTWTSENSSVATIAANSGLATGVATGTTKITATMGGVVSPADTLTVTATLTSIAVTPANPSVAKGATLQFTATGNYSNGTTQNITTSSTWASGTASVATIGANTGLATGTAAGTSTITAAMDGVMSTANTLNVAPPVIDLPLLVKQKVISGTADKDSQYITVRVYDRSPTCNPAALAAQAPQQAAVGCPVIAAYGQGNVNASGRFAVELEPPAGAACPYKIKAGAPCTLEVRANQFVVAQAMPAGSMAPTPASPVPVFVAPDTYDESPVAWGGVTPTFSTGFVLSQNNGQFSQYNLFIGLMVDNSWHLGASYRADAFAQAQLTSIPAVSCQSSSTTSGTASGTASNCLDINSALNSFISSPKAAVIQGGVFFPIMRDSWKWSYKGDSNTFFIAPIIKGGFQTATSTSQTTTTSPGNSTTSSTLNPQGFYRNLSYGVRFGQYKLSNSWNIAPLLLSHLDFTVGKWSNFDQCPSKGCTTDSQGNLTNLSHPWLLGVEGHLKIPSTPFFAAFDTITPITGARLSDFRFTFGMQVDISCLLGAVTSGQKLNSSGSCDKSQADQSTTAAKTSPTTPSTSPK